MILTLLSLLACGDKPTDTGSATDDTSSSVDTTDTVDPCAPIEGLDGLGMSGSIVFEDGTEPQGNIGCKCASETCFVSKWSDSGFAFLKVPYHPIWTMLLIWFQRSIPQSMQI